MSIGGAASIAYDLAMLQRESLWSDPLDVFEAVASDPFAVLFHGGEVSCWSMIAAAPTHVISAQANDPCPFDELKAVASARQSRARSECGAPFASGIAGFIGYEALNWREPSVAPPPSPYRLPDLQLGVFDAVAAFNRRERRAYVISRSPTAEEALIDALSRRNNDLAPRAANERARHFPSDRKSYFRHVNDIKSRIAAGDLFQANIAHHIKADIKGLNSAYALFRRGVAQSQPAHGAYICSGDAEILSFSPERFFVAEEGGRIIAEPVKGTRRRGSDEAEDEALLRSLVADEKDRAENIMIADLTRNDLAQVCRDHSIREEAICEILTTPTVHHLVSRISGVLREGCGALDALFAMFPCGSISGAPKVEAMRVIAELEGVGRGPYCGAIGFLDDSGSADFSVAIRTAIAERRGDGLALSYGVGAGITLQSDAATEYQETIDKARTFFEALGLASLMYA